MGFERRIFARTDVEVQGYLEWQSRRRIGGVKTRTIPMQTIDLSVEGAKVLLDRKVDIPVGTSLEIKFHEESSNAVVLAVATNDDDADTQMLRLVLQYPPESFMKVIDQWLDATKGGRKFEESSWLDDDFVKQMYGYDTDPANRKAS